MSKKLICFDLDGVLIDSKDIHYESLNKAISLVDSSYVISEDEQKNIYEGLPTKIKLNLLSKNKNLPIFLHAEIAKLKQEFTVSMLNNVKIDLELIDIMSSIKSNNINIAVVSNSIKSTIEMVLSKLGILHYFDLIVSNEDAINNKPHPEMYWKAMSRFGLVPNDTVIFEDSVVGKLSAIDSGAYLIEIKNRKDLNKEKVEKAINYLNNNTYTWKDANLNVVIPMAGAGRRFFDAGYSFPKPLIDVNGKPMIQAVVESLGIQATYIYIVQEEHYEKYGLEYLLNAITPNCKIIKINEVTQGAAITVLKSKEFIDSSKPLVIANSDQIVDWNSRDFMYNLYSKNFDGGIAVFESSHPKWSYAKTNEAGLVVEVAEKKPISKQATVGIYYWKQGSDFVKYAEQMISKNIRVNNEFYVCPVYNEAILDNKKIITFYVKKMHGVGTPEDLERYLNTND